MSEPQTIVRLRRYICGIVDDADGGRNPLIHVALDQWGYEGLNRTNRREWINELGVRRCLVEIPRCPDHVHDRIMGLSGVELA